MAISTVVGDMPIGTGKKMYYFAVSGDESAGFLLIHRDIGEYPPLGLFMIGGKGL
jgi:hypothetical protein